MRIARVVLLIGVASLAASRASAARKAAPATMPCDCTRAPEQLAAVQKLFASRGEGVSVRLTPAAHARYRARVLETYERARCLATCEGIPQPERNDVRVLLAAAAFKSRKLGPTDDAAKERLQHGFSAVEQCLGDPPVQSACRLWHATIRGTLARDKWTPLQLRLPKELLAEFRAARGDAAPGRDEPDGGATRAEASILLRAPGVAGGNTHAAIDLMQQASSSPLFACSVDNRVRYAETLAISGKSDDAIAELRAALAYGLPACGRENAYENAQALEIVARCLQKLEARPKSDPGWTDDCR